jgi:hypothetical protein
VTPENIKIKVGTTLNTACCSVWVWNLVSHIKGGTQAEGIPEYSTGSFLGIRRRKEQETGENCVMRSVMIGTSHRILLE